MSVPHLTLVLEDHSPVYLPGELLCGHLRIDGIPSGDARAVELSVLWHTEGKGDEDMSVHYFERTEADHGELVDVGQPRRFSTVLPNSPLSYNGLIVSIRWCVRARVFLVRGRELSLDVPFQLGEVPDAELVMP